MRSARKPALTLGLFALFGFATLALTAARAEPQGPQQPTPVFAGKELFTMYCASCHGTSARGDGPIGGTFKKRPPDLTQFAKQNNGTFPGEMVRKIIDGREPVRGHGGSNMPVWGDAFSRSREGNDPESVRKRIQAIVDYLDTVQERPAANQ